MGLSYRDPYKEKEDGELKNTLSDHTNPDNSAVVGNIKGNDDGNEQQLQKQDQQKQDQKPLKQQQLQTDPTHVSHTSAFLSIAR